jgi:hypothetical protein
MPFSLNGILRSNFYIRLTSWEYWPFGIIQLPLFFYYPWLSLKAGSLTFFASSNPGITMGGMFGESKFDVLKLIPARLIPKSFLVKQPATTDQIIGILKHEGFHLPVIFKPDIGERGYLVRRIVDTDDIAEYLRTMKHDFIIQELVEMPFEFGVFYKRLPDTTAGIVTSIVMKEMLSVTGNGRSSLKELILAQDRARLQWPVLQKQFASRLDEIVPPGAQIEIVSIGNHCLGTKFLNGNHLITTELSSSFDTISKDIDGFFFGRFDLRCNSIEDLQKGRVKILELNGCGAEPAHIYDPGFSLSDAILTLIDHWSSIYEVAMQNKRRGYPFPSLRDGLRFYKDFKLKVP